MRAEQGQGRSLFCMTRLQRGGDRRRRGQRPPCEPGRRQVRFRRRGERPHRRVGISGQQLQCAVEDLATDLHH